MQRFMKKWYRQLRKDPEILRKVRQEMGIEPPDGVEPDDWYKRALNRAFRERTGRRYALYPEVDTVYERLRSRLVRLWNRVSKRYRR